MRIILITLAVLVLKPYFKDPVINTIWTFKVGNGCIDSLVFKPHYKVTEYDCELNYKMKGSYQFSKDTLIVTIKEDSHSEDGGKPQIYRTKYFLINKSTSLHLINRQQFNKSKWQPIRVIGNYVEYRKAT